MELTGHSADMQAERDGFVAYRLVCTSCGRVWRDFYAEYWRMIDSANYRGDHYTTNGCVDCCND